MTATLPKLTEREFMDQVTQLAELRGWSWAHFRPAQTTKGWRTPVSGPLGKGWPDLVLVRTPDGGPRRLLFAELKSDAGRESYDQSKVLLTLDELRWSDELRGVEVRVWRPRDWDRIAETLR